MSAAAAGTSIKNWRSIVTLLAFVFANTIVLFPFHVPLYIPAKVFHAVYDGLSALRILPPRRASARASAFVRLNFPMNFVTAPLIAALLLLAMLAIGAKEVKEGTLGADNISPLDIMLFFITLAYIAISIDASGLIRFLAFKVLQWGGKVGHRLFFYLYVFFFALTSFVGNDPVILSGTAFLAYMTRVSSNIVHPRAWIHTQFAVANIGSAILVSSNPTNLVLAGAFQIKFIEYTANMVVPAVVTAIVLFPFLLYIVFASESLIPISIKMHELPEEVRSRKPVNPNIPHARGTAEQEEDAPGEQGKLLSLEEIMNPFLDKRGATFGAVIMAATLIAVLALNAATTGTSSQPVYYVTVPAAVIMFVWDLGFGWLHRAETREIAKKGREELERMKRGRPAQDEEEITAIPSAEMQPPLSSGEAHGRLTPAKAEELAPKKSPAQEVAEAEGSNEKTEKTSGTESPRVSQELQQAPEPKTLVSLSKDFFRWSQETFPTASAVILHLPFALVPFAFSMFVLVQGLVTKGWVDIFAIGWEAWATKTGTVGAIAGMGFLSVILCNFSGTNIGTTILLSRVIQSWLQIYKNGETMITNRMFWGSVYSMAIGVNYGAFSAAFSASLAGMLWRDILAKKHIRVRRLDFARINVPIISIAMTVGCSILIGEIYIIRDNDPFPIPPSL